MAGPVAAVVVNQAAAVPPEVVAAEWEAAARVEEDKVAADVLRGVVDKAAVVVDARPAVVVDKAVVAVDARLAVVVDKVVAEEADAPVVAEAAQVVVDKAVVAVVDAHPAGAGAAATVNSLSSGGASRERGAPLFY